MELFRKFDFPHNCFKTKEMLRRRVLVPPSLLFNSQEGWRRSLGTLSDATSTVAASILADQPPAATTASVGSGATLKSPFSVYPHLQQDHHHHLHPHLHQHGERLHHEPSNSTPPPPPPDPLLPPASSPVLPTKAHITTADALSQLHRDILSGTFSRAAKNKDTTSAAKPPAMWTTLQHSLPVYHSPSMSLARRSRQRWRRSCWRRLRRTCSSPVG